MSLLWWGQTKSIGKYLSLKNISMYIKANLIKTPSSQVKDSSLVLKERTLGNFKMEWNMVKGNFNSGKEPNT